MKKRIIYNILLLFKDGKRNECILRLCRKKAGMHIAREYDGRVIKSENEIGESKRSEKMCIPEL